jgi:hypothetical protein
MARPRKNPDPFESLIDQLADAIAARIGTGTTGKGSKAGAPKRKRNFSPEGIERIRAAAKRRWAKYHREKAAASK